MQAIAIMIGSIDWARLMVSRGHTVIARSGVMYRVHCGQLQEKNGELSSWVNVGFIYPLYTDGWAIYNKPELVKPTEAIECLANGQVVKLSLGGKTVDALEVSMDQGKMVYKSTGANVPLTAYTAGAVWLVERLPEDQKQES